MDAGIRHLQHPSHKHDLVLRDLSENCSFDCYLCGSIVKGGPAYICPRCEVFFHEACAELPPKIHHSFHPQHPLVLTKTSEEDNHCSGCHRMSSTGRYRYRCYFCQVQLHVGCAAATLPTPEGKQEAKDGSKEEIVQHFAHEHPLASFQVNCSYWINCTACGEWISDHAYGCHACIFVLHKSCALVPQEIRQHPLHPQHLLTPLINSHAWISCKVCKRGVFRFGYSCQECDLTLDVRCAASVVYPHDAQNSKDDVREIHHFSHPHRLTYCYVKVDDLFCCAFCDKKISNGFYCCPDCRFMIHEKCANFPPKILHPLHPDHALIYKVEHRPYQRERRCYFCNDRLSFHDVTFQFDCEECCFVIDARCAIQSFVALRAGVALTIQNSHGRPMKLSYADCRRCNICGRRNDGLCYLGQEENKMLRLHLTCAELASTSEHPFHPQHPLVLLQSPSKNSVHCSACLKQLSGYTLYCAICEFQIHASCAVQKQTLKHQRHEHKLTYFKQTGHLICNLCYSDCSIDLYRCVQCNYNLHYDCMHLPPSVKHELHIHPLVLRDRLVDDFYDEQYCDLCETVRHPEHGVYYCDECRCSAHIDCVIPKVNLERRIQARDLMLMKLDEEIATLVTKTEAKKKDLEELKKDVEASMEELERLKEKRQEITSSIMGVEAELDRA